MKLKQKSKLKRTERVLMYLFAILLVGSVGLMTIPVSGFENANARSRNNHSYPNKTAKNTTTASSSTSPASTTKTSSKTATPAATTGSNSVAPASAVSTSALPFAGSLVGYWSLNGNAAGIGGNGQTFGNVSYVAGKFGQEAHFDGQSYIEIPDNDNFSPSTSGEKMTISFWFKPDTYNFAGINEGYVNFMGKVNGPGQDEWECRLDNETAYDGFSRSERMNFYTFNSGGGLGAGSALNGAAPVSAWTHVVGEVDGTYTRLYVNGQLVDKDLLSDYNINMSNTAAPLRIGTADKASFVQGSISNVMIYNRALSDSEVNQLYNTSL